MYANNSAQLLYAVTHPKVHDQLWSTPLHSACKNGDAASVKELLESVADPNAQTLARRTPLHFTRELSVFQLLLTSGATANSVVRRTSYIIHLSYLFEGKTKNPQKIPEDTSDILIHYTAAAAAADDAAADITTSTLLYSCHHNSD